MKKNSTDENKSFLILFFLLLILFGTISISHAKTMALSFDDGLDPRIQPRAFSWNVSILNALSNAGDDPNTSGPLTDVLAGMTTGETIVIDTPIRITTRITIETE